MIQPIRNLTRAALVLLALLTFTDGRAAAAGPEPSLVKNLRGEWLTLVNYPASGSGLFFMTITQDGTSLVVAVDGYTTDDHGPIGAGTISDKTVLILMDDNFKPSGLGQVFVGTVVSKTLMAGSSSRGGIAGTWFAFKLSGG